MRYPYIGKGSRSGAVFLFLSEGDGLVLEQGFSSFTGRKNNIVETLCRNITAEHLANTYGEVKSKEHAHFIVELGEGAGYELVGSISPNNAGVFVFDGENKTLFFMLGGGSLRGGSVLKQITIPLPPKCESVDEWPKVNDDVFYKGQKWTFVAKHNDMAMLFWTGDEYCTAKISELQKPKTPEQELCDEISDLAFNQFNDDSYDLTHNSYYLAEQLISKYNITKKGEGDE